LIPVNEPFLGEREAQYVLDCVRTGWVSSAGSYLERFERTFAEWCGRRFGVAVSNGTVALELALECLDLQQGDEVILPTFTIISCLQAVVYAEGTPIFVDADPLTWCANPEEIARKVTSRTRAIMPVHIYGHPVDMDPILQLAQERGIAVVEDAAEAHGAEYLRDWRAGGTSWARCGSFGEMSCFSFYANKVITTGEGGMVLTDDPSLADRLRSRRNLCFQSRRRFLHDELGHNFRMTNLQAALGVAQLERVGDLVARKREIGARYSTMLQGIKGLQLPTEEAWARSVYWMYGLVLDEGTGWDAASAADFLWERGIETRPFFLGMHAQPVVKARWPQENGTFPVADRLARQGLYLPSGLALKDDQLELICEAVKEMMHRRAGGVR
jgi:perosamine synthetase